MLLHVHSNPSCQAEKSYTWHVLFREILGLDYVVVYEPVGNHEIRLPNGQKLVIPDSFDRLSPASDWIYHLDTEGYQEPDFDLYAFCFFQLSRLEEYQSNKLDQHGRFPASASWSFRNGMLQRPVVNECANWLWTKLQRLGYAGMRKQTTFKWSFSCDIDHPRLWWNGFDRLKTLAGALIKRKNPLEWHYWLRHPGILPWSNDDPYDVFDAWMDLFEKHGYVAQFNFMGQRPKGSDCWYPLQHPYIKELMRKMSGRGHAIGFHPGYESFDNPMAFLQELRSVQALTSSPVKRGRQHYLRFNNPRTWQQWEAAGLDEDSTLGYAEMDGFRAGICQSYPVFDLEKRKMLRLRELPLILMDVTLAQYQKLTPEEGLEKVRYYHQVVSAYGGTLTLLWHNSSWNTPFWEPWKKVLEAAIRLDGGG